MPNSTPINNTILLNQNGLTTEQWRLFKLGMNASNVVYNADLPINQVPPLAQVIGPGYVLDNQRDFRFQGGIAQPYASESGWVAIDKVVDASSGGKALILRNATTNEIMISFAGMDGVGNGVDAGAAVAYNASVQATALKPLIEKKLSDWVRDNPNSSLVNENTRWIITGQSMGQANAIQFTGFMLSNATKINSATGEEIPDLTKRFILPNGFQVSGSMISIVGGNGEGVTERSMISTSGTSYATSGKRR